MILSLKNYNKLIRLPFNYTYEKLYKKENTYDINFSIKFQYESVIKNKGSAIFIHVAKKKFKKN